MTSTRSAIACVVIFFLNAQPAVAGAARKAGVSDILRGPSSEARTSPDGATSRDFSYANAGEGTPDNGVAVAVPAHRAAPDSAINDAPALQRAIDGVPLTGGEVLVTSWMALGADGWAGIMIPVGQKNLTIRGVGNAGFRILAIPTQTDPYDVISSYIRTVFLLDNTVDITFRDLQWEGGGLELNFITGIGTRGTRLINNTFRNTGTTARNPHGKTSVAGYDNRNHYILNNTWDSVYTSYGMGLGFVGMCERNAAISGNKFINGPEDTFQTCLINSSVTGNLWDNTALAINLGGATEGSSNVTFTGNTFRDCGTAFRSDVTGSIWNNRITFVGNAIDCPAGFVLAWIDNSVISSNIFGIGNNYGVGGDHWRNTTISNNRIISSGSTYDGIYLSGGNDNTNNMINMIISGNTISGFTGRNGNAIRILGTPRSPHKNIEISNNIVHGNTHGLSTFPHYNNMVLQGNIFHSNTSTDITLRGTNNYGLNNVYRSITYGAEGTPLKHVIGGQAHSYGSAAPTRGTWAAGDITWNIGSDNVIGWKCTSGGSPGTWKRMQTTLER